MAIRWSLLLLAGLTGCAMHLRSSAPHPVVLADHGPRLVIVTGTDLRYCDECADDVFFYSDFWWSYRSDGWYRSRSWGAPWVVVEMGRLPAAFIDVPPARFRHRYGPWHPAHDHYPARDHWAPEGTPVQGGGDRHEGDASPGRGHDNRRDEHATGRGERDRREPVAAAGEPPGQNRGADQSPGPGRGDVQRRDKAEDRQPEVREADGKDKDRDKEKRKEKVREKKDKDDKENEDRERGKARARKRAAGTR